MANCVRYMSNSTAGLAMSVPATQIGNNYQKIFYYMYITYGLSTSDSIAFG